MIFAGNIPDFLWPNVLFAAIYIKNRHFTKDFNGMSFYEKLKGKPPLVHHLWALGSIIYSLIAKENCVKSAKFALWAKKGVLIGYDSKIIYCIWLLDKQKIKWLKDIKIYKSDISSKTIITFTEDLFNKQRREDTTTSQLKPLSRKRQQRFN